MEEDKIGKLNSRFYDALGKSQPIAFLASLALVISAFTATNQQLVAVYDYSVIGGIMFLISFVISLIDQMDQKHEENIPIFHWGKFFFSGIGILYLSLVAWEFSRSLPQIPSIILGWVAIAIGGSLFARIIFHQARFKRPMKGGSVYYKLAKIFGLIGSLGWIGTGVIFVGRGFFQYHLLTGLIGDTEGVFGIIGIVFTVLGGIFLIINDSKERRKQVEENS